MASGGNTPERASGSATPAPSRTPTSTSASDRATTWLLVISLTMPSACTMGTPLLRSVPSVRAIFATSILRTTSPTIEQAQLPLVPRQRALGRADPVADAEHEQRDDREAEPPVVAQALGHRHHDARRQRQRLAHVVEQGGELRQHVGQQHQDRHAHGAGQHHRVGQGGARLVTHLLRALEVLEQALEHGFEKSADLAGAHHVDVEAREEGMLATSPRRATCRRAPTAGRRDSTAFSSGLSASSTRVPRLRSSGRPADSSVDSSWVTTRRSFWPMPRRSAGMLGRARRVPPAALPLALPSAAAVPIRIGISPRSCRRATTAAASSGLDGSFDDLPLRISRAVLEMRQRESPGPAPSTPQPGA